VLLGDLIVALLAALAGFMSAIWLLLLWIGDRAATAFGRSPDRLDPILGPRDRIVICNSEGPFIPMPDNLRTSGEIVAWMTQELPKLTAEKPKHSL
jgi:hypothetical protein